MVEWAERNADAPDADHLAWTWADAISETSYVVISRHNLAIRLSRRVDQLIKAIRSDEDSAQVGQEIGAALVASHFTDTSALAVTLRLLGQHLAPIASYAGQQQHLHTLLGSLAGGYADALRERTLTEQQRIHSAVIAARDHAERERWNSQARFEAVFSEAAIGIGIGGLDGRILEVNQALCDMLGYTREELRELSASHFLHPSDDPAVWSRLSDLMAGDIDHYRMQKAYYRRNGTEIWTDLVVTLIRDHEGAPRYAVGMIQDVTDRQELLNRMRYQATHDPLTTLPNRTLFFDRLNVVLAKQGSQDHIGICFLDLDGFKAVNDTLGHDAGDELLRIIATRLASELAGEGRVVARMGGDEFVILVEAPSSQDDLISLAKVAQAAVRTPIEVDGHTLTVTASVGVVHLPIRGASAAELMKAADTTLYWAKSDGRDRWAVFDHRRHDHAVQRYRLAADMPKALGDRQFFLEYQPIVQLDDRAVVGVEALLRWQHPVLGRLGPDQFIDLAENTRMIVTLGQRVIREACRQARAWRGMRPAWTPVISVNISPRQLAEPAIVDQISEILEETELEPGALQLELTESTLMSATGQPLSNLHMLADLGVKIALDDFGTGYSNLAYLNSLPIHVLKLAGPFVAALDKSARTDTADTDILQMIIQLAHALKLTVIAEGVETNAQAEVLAKLRCDLAQGWHFGRALPAHDLAHLLPG
jgi:diguanylate cyclase (GGDEF)-like protein/PAS domain S-box-containing protein